jgi:hypothetical protein
MNSDHVMIMLMGVGREGRGVPSVPLGRTWL